MHPEDADRIANKENLDQIVSISQEPFNFNSDFVNYLVLVHIVILWQVS